jgi:HD-like signal output (HDOD) protein
MDRPFQEIVRQLRTLEPFPQTALRVLELSSAEDSAPGDLVEVIQSDPALTGKVLRLCNSAYYGFRREIASLREAGNALGTKTVVNLVLTSCTNRYFRNYGGAAASSHDRLWRNCITNAISSRMLAQSNGSVDVERAYTAGLLQNVGNLVLDRFLADARDQVLEQVSQGRTALDAERVVLGLTHAEIGARLLTHWGLPEVLVDTVRFHHAPHEANVDRVLAGTIHLAETLTWAVGAADGLEEVPYEVCTAALDLTRTTRKKLSELPERLRAELSRAKLLLEV